MGAEPCGDQPRNERGASQARTAPSRTGYTALGRALSLRDLDQQVQSLRHEGPQADQENALCWGR